MSDPYVEFPVDLIVDVHWPQPQQGPPPGSITQNFCQDLFYTGRASAAISGGLLDAEFFTLPVPEVPDYIKGLGRTRRERPDQHFYIWYQNTVTILSVTASYTGATIGSPPPPKPWETISNIVLHVSVGDATDIEQDVVLGDYTEGDHLSQTTTLTFESPVAEAGPPIGFSGSTGGGTYTGPLIWSPFYDTNSGSLLIQYTATGTRCSTFILAP